MNLAPRSVFSFGFFLLSSELLLCAACHQAWPKDHTGGLKNKLGRKDNDRLQQGASKAAGWRRNQSKQGTGQ
jgi:hypothetical protein